MDTWRWNITYNQNAVHNGRQMIPLLYEPFAETVITACQTIWTHDASIQGKNLWGWGGGEEDTWNCKKKGEGKEEGKGVWKKIIFRDKSRRSIFCFFNDKHFRSKNFHRSNELWNYFIVDYSYFKFINVQIKSSRNLYYYPILDNSYFKSINFQIGLEICTITLLFMIINFKLKIEWKCVRNLYDIP